MTARKPPPAPTADEIFGVATSLTTDVPREFRRLGDDHYGLRLGSLGIDIQVDRLRRRTGELIGELAVRCEMDGARTYDGMLSVADFNLSSLRAREERAKYLAVRAQAKDLDWSGLLEEFVQRVLGAERQGYPAVSLRDLPKPAPDDTYDLDGFTLLARHPAILFGDGGAAKSYLALYCAGQLARRGLKVALFDWELAGEDHRVRLEALFGLDMPDVKYLRCDRPLTDTVDQLRRIVRDDHLDYAVFDSVAFACDGPPEAAEVASRYFQALRSLGPLGSLHVAHISKAEGSDQKPFGSAFWHNGARVTWYATLADVLCGSQTIQIGLYNRKANLTRLRPAVGFEFRFEDRCTLVSRVEIGDVADLAARLPVHQRMYNRLKRGAMSVDALATEIDADEVSIRKAASRRKQIFTSIQGGKIGLLDPHRDEL